MTAMLQEKIFKGDIAMTLDMERINGVIKALKSNNMEACFCNTAEEAKNMVESMLKEGDTVTHGGSVTLAQCGIPEMLRCGKYNYLDRSTEGLTREQVQEIYRKSFFADVYLTSANAITESGSLFNVDGNSNRTAAILFGPKSVIVVAGANKIVKDLGEAFDRLRTTAAPLNTVRLKCETYCAEKGKCISLNNSGSEMGDGCKSPQRICCNYVVSAFQREKNRIKVIIVGEELGY